MRALVKLGKMVFISLQKPFSFLRKSNFSISDFQISWHYQMCKHKTRNTFYWITSGSVSHTPQLGRIAYCGILVIIAYINVQLGVWQCCKPSPVESRGKAQKNFDYFAFWITQNITIMALQQQPVTKPYSRNQHFDTLEVWVWGPKPVYRLQNTSGYGTV